MKNNNQPKWDIAEAESVYWICPEAAWAMSFGMRQVYGFGFNRNVVIFQAGKPFKWSVLTSELELIGRRCFEKFKNKAFRQKIEKQYQQLKKDLDKAIIQYRSKDIKILSDIELFGYLELFTEYYRKNFSIGFFVEPFDYVFPKIFENRFKLYNFSPKVLSDLSAIPVPSYLNLELRDLIKIALKKQSGKKIDSDLLEHKKKYEWLMTGHHGKKNINQKFFLNRINQLSQDASALRYELKKLQNYSRDIKLQKNKIIKKFNLDQPAIKLIELINEVSPWHDLRKELFVKSIYYADDVRQNLGKRFGYELEEMQFFTTVELKNILFGKKLNKKEIKNRKEFIYFDFNFKNKKIKILKGKKFLKIVPKDFLSNHLNLKEISGFVASPGKAIGFAKVIFGASGFAKLKNGDILVTGMTRPEMLPIMRKASAIITDEGGLTCHAAIVSRELGIPCIIGTKTATKVILDGEKIEVDAYKGIVKKI